jgi:Zn-dependent protease with chaperone function
MILSYLPRLACLVLACFFLTHAATALAVAMSAQRALRRAESLAPRPAARLVLSLKLMPLGLAAFCAVGICAPSYLRFEPERVDERVSLICLAMAIAGSAIAGIAIIRGLLGCVRSLRFLRRCREAGSVRDDLKALVIGSPRPLVALAGIVAPRVIMSLGIVEALNEEELAAVLSHESAHRGSWDNLKRLLMSLTPGFASLDRAWVRFAEFAADEEAVAGDAMRAVALASALVRVSRFGPIVEKSAVAIFFLGNTTDLTERVDRLLAPRPCVASSQRTTVSALLLAGCLAVLAFNPATLRLVQSLLEGLIR